MGCCCMTTIPLSTVAARSLALGRVDKGKGTPDGGLWWRADGKGGTRGVATGIAARFRRGRL